MLPYLGKTSCQTGTKLQQALKSVLNCCKLEIAFKCKTRVSNSFRYKDPVPKDLIDGVASTYANFSILTHENKMHFLEIKKNLLIMRDKQPQNRNISSAPLYLFSKVS